MAAEAASQDWPQGWEKIGSSGEDHCSGKRGRQTEK